MSSKPPPRGPSFHSLLEKVETLPPTAICQVSRVSSTSSPMTELVPLLMVMLRKGMTSLLHDRGHDLLSLSALTRQASGSDIPSPIAASDIWVSIHRKSLERKDSRAP